MKIFEPLTDLQWEKIKSLFPNPPKRGRGKPHTPWRQVVNSVLYVLATKTKWGSLPKGSEFASKSAAHRWFLAWTNSGLLESLLGILKQVDPHMELCLPQRRNPIREIEYETEEKQIPLYAIREEAEAILPGIH